MRRFVATVINARNRVFLYRDKTLSVRIHKRCINETRDMLASETEKEQTSQGNLVKQDWVQGNENEVLFDDYGDSGLITLNRPHALNALKVPMSQRIYEVLKKWESSKKLVIIQGAGDKAFCVGGDTKLVKYMAEPNSHLLGQHFFRTFYMLYHLVGTYKVPYVAIMNHVTMGGGCGVSVLGKYRIVTEKSVFAMPEVSIGFYPDAGCSYIFPRLKGQLGKFLGLTAHRLKGADILHAGIATHYVSSEKLNDLKEELLSKPTETNQILETYSLKLPASEFSLTPYIEKINHCFSPDTVEEIIKRLETDNSEWAQKTLNTLSLMSPTSLKVTCRAFEEGKRQELAECLKMEFRLSLSFVSPNSDFFEASKVRFLDKNYKPKWNPKNLKEVTEESVLKRFKPLHPNIESKL